MVLLEVLSGRDVSSHKEEILYIVLLEVLSGRDVSSFTRFYVTLLQTRNKYHAIKRFSQLAEHAMMSFSMIRYSGPTRCDKHLDS